MLVRGVFGGGAASGSSGSQVASHNRFGQYLRARTKPVNPQTAFQSAVRNAVKDLTSRWNGTLTQAQRDAWSVYALNVPVLNRLGDSVTLTGLNMYVRSNTPRIQASMAVVDDAPTDFSLGSLTPPALEVGEGTNSGTITWATGQDWQATTSASAAMLVYASRPTAGSINYFTGPYQFAGRVNNTSGTATLTLPFTAAGTDSKMWWTVRVSRADGRLTSSFPGSVFAS